ncbi:MAG: endonuclease III [bacterium]|nr:endonuclease III [bacterium]
MVRRLDKQFGGEAWDKKRIPPDPLDDLMRTILSQNTTDENRDRGYHTLRDRYPTWEAVMKAPLAKVKDAIRIAGLANQKGPAMQGFLRWLQEERGALSLDFLKGLSGEEGIGLLVQHKGIGIKTASIVLAFACGKDLCAVDTHVHRILRRVGIIDERCGREKAHTILAPLIPKGKARSFHVNLIDFGKTVCQARNPKCDVCPISHRCAYFQQAG